MSTKQPIVLRPLQGICLCIHEGSGVSERGQQMAVALGAKVSTVVDRFCGYFVSNRVGGQHYLDAMSTGVHIVRESWLKECWKNKTLASWDEHRLPVFAGLQFCCTGIRPPQRTALIQCIKDCGGSYNDQLEKEKTTHLIANDAEGDKVAAALRWRNIAVISPKWVETCVQQKQWIREDAFVIRKVVEKKKLESSTTEEVVFPAGKRVKQENNTITPLASELNSALQSVAVSESRGSAPSVGTTWFEIDSYLCTTYDSTRFPSPESITLNRRLLLQQRKLFLVGVAAQMEDYIIRCVLYCGGHISFQLTPEVDYVVRGHLPLDESLVQRLNQPSTQYQFINLLWLLDQLFDDSQWSHLLRMTDSTPEVQSKM